MEMQTATPAKKKEPKEKKKNNLLLIIGLVSLIFDLLLAFLFFYWRYNSTHLTYEEISRMTVTDTALPEGYDTNGEIHYSAGSDGYVQFTALNQRLDTPSFGPHASYSVAFDVTALIYYSDEAYDASTPTFTVIGYDSAGQPLETVRMVSSDIGEMVYMNFTTPAIDHFVFYETGPACSLEQTQALAGIGHIIILVPKEVSL